MWTDLESKIRAISHPGVYIDNKHTQGQREKIRLVTVYHIRNLPGGQQQVH